ncbi:MAG: iron ABC transporter permease [Pseudomonadota bacterium]|nr:iron ABC transporter permease [Pseudomonadota bacterium]
MSRTARLTPPEAAVLWALALLVVAVAAWPLLRLAMEAVAPGGTLDSGPLREALDSRSTWRATRRSLETSAVGMVGAVLLGGLFAFLVALTDIRGRAALVFAFMLPMMIPPHVTALAWIQLFGPSSALLNAIGLAPPIGAPNPIYSPGGIMLLLSIQHAPLAFLVLRAAFRQVPRELVEAARLSGAGPFGLAGRVVIPMLAPAVIAAAGLSFVSALGNFGIPALLGIPQSYYVLPTLIYRRLASFGPSVIADAAVLALLIGLIGVIALLAQSWLSRRMESRLTSRPGAILHVPLGRWRPAVEAGLWAIIVAILVIPLAGLVAMSLVPAYGVGLGLSTVTLDNFAEVMFRQQAPLRAFANSTGLALLAALVLAALALPLGYLQVWRGSRIANWLTYAAEAPYALPGVVLAIAMILVFLKPLPLLDLTLYGTLGIIFAAYLGRFFALALRPVAAGFAQADPRLDEAARLAGAGFWLRLRAVLAPLFGPMAAAGAILVFMTAFNELTVSALLWSSGTETIGVVIFNYEDGGYSVLSSAMAVLAVVAVLVIMLAAQAARRLFPPGVLPWTDDRDGR